MLRITVEVDAEAERALGIKEDLAMYLEQFGDSRIVKIEVVTGDQQTLKGMK